MSEGQRLEAILDQAKENEREYEWMKAVKFYTEAVDFAVNQKDFLKAGKIQQRLGHCFRQAAFQAQTNDEFQLRLRRAQGAYLEAAKHYLKIGDRFSNVLARRCKAMAIYAILQLSKKPAERRSLLDQSMELEEKSLGEITELRLTTLIPNILANILTLLDDRVDLEASPEKRKQLFRKALIYGHDVEKLSNYMDPETLADCLISLAWHHASATSILPKVQVQNFDRKVADYCKQAVELAEKSGNKELLAKALLADAGAHLGTYEEQWASEIALTELERAVALVRQTGNKRILAWAYTMLARDLTFGTFARESDPKCLKSTARRIEDLAARALKHHRVTGDEAGASWVYGVVLDVLYCFIALDLEKTYDRIIKAWEKSVNYVNKALELAEKSANISATTSALLNAPIILHQASTVAKDAKERQELLRKACELGERSVNFLQSLFPNSIMVGFVLPYYSAAKAELAMLGGKREEQIAVLSEAADLCERGVEVVRKGTSSIAAVDLLGRIHTPLLEILSQLFKSSGEEKHGRRLLRALNSSIEVFENIGKAPPVAELLWRYAQTLNRVGEYYEAADRFSQARDKFNSLAKEYPLLERHFRDYAIYMDAWSEIANAKQTHEEFSYIKASKLYHKASGILGKSPKWTTLKAYYAAYSSLETGEEHSRNLNTVKAISDFQEATQQFTNANVQLRSLQKKEETVRIEEEISQLVTRSQDMITYSQGRTKYEQARLADLKGQKRKSSALYKAAQKIFAELTARASDERTRTHMAATALLCQAWSQMKEAEYAKSSEGYDEAAELFRKAGEQAERGKPKTLAMANASLCKALELLTRYNESLESSLFAPCKQLLEKAERLYLEVGFKQIANWVRATERFMDAQIFLGKAETEIEEDKKTRHYHLAEKNFELAARLYGKAGYETEKEQTLSQLERTREEKEIFTAPLGIDVSPQLPSSSSEVSSFYLRQEQPVGIEHFEHAEVQSSTNCDPPKVSVGDYVTVWIAMINSGKNPAFIVKIDGIVTEGLELRKKPVLYTLKENHLDMKGRRLDPLKTEELQLTYRSLKKGTFTLKPKIHYLEASGKYRLHEPEPVTITVKELGIKGWIKGER